MDVSPRALRAVTFREKLRGYHPDDVDAFLERVADGVAGLEARLDDALARAEKAEKEGSAATEGEDAVRRTLMLAQRTADLALKEATEEAARLVNEARDTADQLADNAQKQLRSDLERLETARKQLQGDVIAMQEYVAQERSRVRTALAELVRKVDSSTRRPPPPPAPSKLDVPSVVPRAVPPLREAPVQEAPAEHPRPEAPRREPQQPPPQRVRREPQPPPVTGSPFAASRPAPGRPNGPPPGPRRHAAAAEPASARDDASEEPGPAQAEENPGLRPLFGR